MRIRLVFTLLTAATLSTVSRSSSATPPRDSTAPREEISALIASLRVSARASDSLASMADTTNAASRGFLEEQIWQHHSELHTTLLAVADKVRAEQCRCADATEVRRVLSEGIREEWPHYLVQLQRWGRVVTELKSGPAASGITSLAIESDLHSR